MKEHKKKNLSTAQVIALGFFSTICVGAILLSLPIASTSGQWTNPVDALFTATTSVCVTGLVVVDTFSYWNIFGKLVILCLIQLGGLGIVTLTTTIMVFIGKKITLKDRLLLEDAYNLNTLSGLVRFMKRIIRGTFVIEAIGAICYSFVFIPRFGFIKGIFVSVFNAVSAFCNAGMDIIGPYSLMEYVSNPWINVVTMLLIIFGGIGFIVWWDVVRVLGLLRQKTIVGKQFFQKLKLHSKLVLVTTLILIVVGAIGVFILEYSNKATIGDLSLGSKILASLFQSVTTRTAGFATIAQDGLTDGAALLCICLMFIGGSPVGTAGGIKTTTMAVLFLSALSVAKGKDECTVFKRTIPRDIVRKTVAVVVFSFMVTIGAILLLAAFEQGVFMDIVYETVSAMGTVGLSRSFTTSMDVAGRIIIILCMFFGRVGSISMVIAFNFKKGKNLLLDFPKEDITVG